MGEFTPPHPNNLCGKSLSRISCQITEKEQCPGGSFPFIPLFLYLTLNWTLFFFFVGVDGNFRPEKKASGNKEIYIKQEK